MLKGYSRVVVTGGMGFIGRHLVDELLQMGKDVLVLDNLSRTTSMSIQPNVSFVNADICNPSQLAPAMRDIELVVHTAGNSSGTVSVDDPRFDFETNAVGTFNIAEAALQAGVRRFVYLSSASVYGTPQRFPIDEEHPTKPFVPYGASKLSGEVACLSLFHSAGLPVVMVRPFCVYGPGENPKWALVEVSRYLRWHLNSQPIEIIGDIDQKTRDFVHVRDVVASLLLIADRAEAGEIFNVGSGEEVSMRQLTQIIGIATGREPLIRAIPEITADTYRLVGDISKLRSIGYTPQQNFLDGIRELAVQLGETPELPSGATIFKRGQERGLATAGRP